jgi:hypothetical protein
MSDRADMQGSAGRECRVGRHAMQIRHAGLQACRAEQAVQGRTGWQSSS